MRALLHGVVREGPPEEVTSQLRPEGERRCSATQDLTEEVACAKAPRQERAV